MSEAGRPQPYIGISGVAHHEQHTALHVIAEREHIDALGYFMMVGVQATGKTQVQDIENRRGRMWHPVGDEITSAAIRDESGLTKPYIHGFFTDAEMDEGISNVMRRTEDYVRGIQFNGLHWADRDYSGLFKQFTETYPQQSIILQASSAVLGAHTPEELTDELAKLPVDYVLLDPSGGYGRPLDADTIRWYVDEIYQRQLPVGVAVAGGLDAQTIEELFLPMARDFPGLSCDAEGRLRKGEEGATEIDLQLAEDFILAWKGMIKGLDQKTLRIA